jgi:hypothetical protein
MARLIRGFLVLTGVMFISAQALVGVAQLASRDFLAAYRSLTPGNSIVREDLPCQLRVGMSNGVEVGMCQFEAEDEVFGRVTLVTADQIVTRLAFEVEPEALHIGDLVVCWGNPNDLQAPPGSLERNNMTSRWQNRIFAGHNLIRGGGQASYFLPVTYLSLEVEMMPCEAPE